MHDGESSFGVNDEPILYMIFCIQVFGCDGHMNSGKKFDQCAVCNGGGNSCTKVSGNFNGGTSKGIITLIVTPILKKMRHTFLLNLLAKFSLTLV